MSYGIRIESEQPKPLPETFQLARARIAAIGPFEPPLTFRELRHCYRAARVNGTIFLRCTFGTSSTGNGDIDGR